MRQTHKLKSKNVEKKRFPKLTGSVIFKIEVWQRCFNVCPIYFGCPILVPFPGFYFCAVNGVVGKKFKG